MAFGVGGNVDNEELRRIAMGDPDSVIKVNSFDQVAKTSKVLSSKLCQIGMVIVLLTLSLIVVSSHGTGSSDSFQGVLLFFGKRLN